MKLEQSSNKPVLYSTKTKFRPNRTPSPFTPNKDYNKYKYSTINVKSNIFTKIKNPKRDLSISMTNLRSRGKSENIRDSKNLKTISRDRSFKNKNQKSINYEKEYEDLKTKLSIQKQVNERLMKEINNMKKKSKGNISSPLINTKNAKEKNINESKNISLYMKKNILKFNEKINNISDLMISLTFSINSLQNKKEISQFIESDFENIKKNLLNITTEISELKSCLLKISLDDENGINTDINTNNNKYSSYLDSDDDNNNSSNEQINILKKENLNLQNSIEIYKSQILNLNQMISEEQKSKEELKNNYKNNILNNDEIKENTNKISSNINKTNKEEDETYLKDISTMSYSEVLTLKEELRNSEKKYLELKGMFDSNIESKNLIENLLKKNNEEIKRTYEHKITKLKKKLEEKEKEINKLKE